MNRIVIKLTKTTSIEYISIAETFTQPSFKKSRRLEVFVGKCCNSVPAIGVMAQRFQQGITLFSFPCNSSKVLKHTKGNSGGMHIATGIAHRLKSTPKAGLYSICPI